MDKRFIEESFPVKEVSESAVHERNLRRGISNFHMWWARKPLSVSIATNYAALIPASTDEIDWVKKRNTIIKLSFVDGTMNKDFLNDANKLLLDHYGKAPVILDPFAGGGSIPLGALKIGCETYANDYNPVAVLIEKCILEYPQSFQNINKNDFFDTNVLISEIEKWAIWVFNEVNKEIKSIYPKEKGSNIPIGYYWMHTISCGNPKCQLDIPLTSNWWLSKRKNKKIALRPLVNDAKIHFEIVGQLKQIPSNFDPSKGTIKRSVVTCPSCGFTFDSKTLKKLFLAHKSRQKLVTVVLGSKKKRGKFYRIPSKEDFENLKEVQNTLNLKIKTLWNKYGINPIPDEELPLMSGTFNVPLYGINKWGDLFNERQKLSLITFIEKIKCCYDLLSESDEVKAKIIITYLAAIFDRMILFSNILCRWQSGTEQNVPSFGVRNSVPMLFNYFEVNTLGDISTSWKNTTKIILKSLKTIDFTSKPAKISFNSAKNLNFPDNFFDAIFTDPPYYNSVPYADLSDFYYVWLKRILGDIYPELFSTPLTPKSDEIAEMSTWDNKRYSHKDKQFFEDNIKIGLKEINRVLKPEGIVTIVYAHKTTDGWETIINAILDSDLVVTASWPIHTESREKAHAKKMASLASSIYIIARKTSKADVAWYKEVKDEIKEYIPYKLDKLWEEGISGADFFIAAIGSAIEIFGKYEKILDNEGNELRANNLLNFVRDMVSEYAIRQILHNTIVDKLSPLTKFYLMWRWNYHESKVQFDEARKLAQSAGIDLVKEWNKGFIFKSGEFITIQGPQERDIKSLEDSRELIDVLHHVCLLWKGGKQDEMKIALKKQGYIEGEALYKVAQAISETLPNSSTEKKLIEGFLASKNKIIQDLREEQSQTKLI